MSPITRRLRNSFCAQTDGVFKMAGNSNSGRRAEKPFADALRMELKAAGENHKALRMIARALIMKAADGDMQAIKEFADRIDGKVPQGVIGGDEDDAPLSIVVRIGGNGSSA